MNLVKNTDIRECLAPIAAASNTDSNTDIIDMQGYDGAVFITPITDSVDTGVAALTIEQNTANSDTGMAALSGAVHTKTSAANDDLNNTCLVVDIYKPRERYIQGVVTSTTANIAFGNTLVIKYKGSKAPVTAHASITGAVTVISPAEA